MMQSSRNLIIDYNAMKKSRNIFKYALKESKKLQIFQKSNKY